MAEEKTLIHLNLSDTHILAGAPYKQLYDNNIINGSGFDLNYLLMEHFDSDGQTDDNFFYKLGETYIDLGKWKEIGGNNDIIFDKKYDTEAKLKATEAELKATADTSLKYEVSEQTRIITFIVPYNSSNVFFKDYLSRVQTRIKKQEGKKEGGKKTKSRRNKSRRNKSRRNKSTRNKSRRK